jgi:hypothetical protein
MWRQYKLRRKPHLALVNVGKAFRWKCSVKLMPCVGYGTTPQEAFSAWKKDAIYWGHKYLDGHPQRTAAEVSAGKALLQYARVA